MISLDTHNLTTLLLDTYPNLQAVYLFGSFANQTETRESDIDLALLLPHKEAKQTGSLMLSPLHLELEKHFNRSVDLINLRLVSTVLQKQVIDQGVLLTNRDENAVDEFEM